MNSKTTRIISQKKMYRYNTVFEFLQEQVKDSGQLHGYRWMHLRCLRNGFTITRETVRLALRLVDPHGVDI